MNNSEPVQHFTAKKETQAPEIRKSLRNALLKVTLGWRCGCGTSKAVCQQGAWFQMFHEGFGPRLLSARHEIVHRTFRRASVEGRARGRPYLFDLFVEPLLVFSALGSTTISNGAFQLSQIFPLICLIAIDSLYLRRSLSIINIPKSKKSSSKATKKVCSSSQKRKNAGWIFIA